MNHWKVFLLSYLIQNIQKVNIVGPSDWKVWAKRYGGPCISRKEKIPWMRFEPVIPSGMLWFYEHYTTKYYCSRLESRCNLNCSKVASFNINGAFRWNQSYNDYVYQKFIVISFSYGQYYFQYISFRGHLITVAKHMISLLIL